MNDFIEILKYTIPAIVTGGVAAYFLREFIAIENSKRNFDLLTKKKETTLPIRLQAYERMTLYLERIHILNLTNRVTPNQLHKIDYAKLLINHINAEFEHNLVQQIYMSHDCWQTIKTAKETILNNITAISMRENINSGEDLHKNLRTEFSKGISATDLALQFIQKEVHQLL